MEKKKKNMATIGSPGPQLLRYTTSYSARSSDTYYLVVSLEMTSTKPSSDSIGNFRRYNAYNYPLREDLLIRGG